MMSRYSSDSGAAMTIYKLSLFERDQLMVALENAKAEILVGSDPIDRAFKVKIDGGLWTPPMGEEIL
jgi:hypothetical protein